MKGLQKTIILLLLAVASPAIAQPYFTPNLGQWTGDFRWTARFGHIDFYMDSTSFAFTQWNYETQDQGHFHELPNGGHHYRVHFLGANPRAAFEGEEEAGHYENYFLGTREYWRTGVRPVGKLSRPEFYPGVELEVYTRYGQLKYDLIAEDARNLRTVQMYYDGVDSLFIREGRLHTLTSVGEVIEIRPYAYNPETRKPIEASYRLSGDTVSFQLDPNYQGPVVLDPTYIFSTFMGSSQDNFGYSATYDPVDSTVYAAGIVYLVGGTYPTTTGVFDSTYNGSVDVVISKLSSDGKQLVYSTYLGGAGAEQPSSLVVDSMGRLAVLGSTSSLDFPVTPGAVKDTMTVSSPVSIENFTYTNGVDMFVTVFGPLGMNLVGSTYLGGSGLDGVNPALDRNYGDPVRGEIIYTPWGTLMIASSTTSMDIPLVVSDQNSLGGTQDVWLIEMPRVCNVLMWSTYFGGSGADAGYSIRVSGDYQYIYACGATRSNDLPGTAGGYQAAYGGTEDGFIGQWTIATRVLVQSTYNGTGSFDANFLMDLDRDDNVYVYGQTLGNYPTTPGAISESNASMFVHKFSSDLTQSLKSLAFGNGFAGSTALSPTAFAVDGCLDIYLSGWGGTTNRIVSTTVNMVTTSDAYQDTTDGSDLYFAVIDGSFTRYNYATYFGGIGAAEHVDGGTSRFDSRGIIFQAICADCGSQDNYPTFPSDVLSRVNPSPRCNLAVTVIDFEQQDARVSVSAPDTVCTPFTLVVQDTITGADIVIWDFGGGDIDTNNTLPFRQYNTPGTYSVTVIGLDTNCGTSDTAQITFEVIPGSANASFTADYDPCDPQFGVVVELTDSTGLDVQWDFGDGTLDTSGLPVSHNYATAGTYTIRAIVERTDCFGQVADTAEIVMTFHPAGGTPGMILNYQGCSGSGEAVLMVTGSTGYQNFSWSLSDGRTFTGPLVSLIVDEGPLTVTLVAEDTVCGRTETRVQTFTIEGVSENLAGRVPNAFSPDGDGNNDTFRLQDGTDINGIIGFSVKVYDRWGQLLFESGTPSFEWDGTFEGRGAPEGVYFWIVRGEPRCGGSIERNGILHLMKQ